MSLMNLIGPFVAGAALGAAYLGLLWLTVRRLPRTEHKSTWLIASAALRMAALLAAFFLIMDDNWQRLLACLAGFVVVRLAITGRIRTSAGKRASPS